MKLKKSQLPNSIGRRKSFIKLIAFCVFFSICSCKKFVEINPPHNQIISALVFKDDNTATSAINGIYSQIMASPLYLLNGAMTVYPGLGGDEIYNTSPDPSLDQFAGNSIISNNSIVQNNLWRNAYIFIYQSNACIEGLNKSETLSPTVKNQLLGEAMFIRALTYFYLVNVFGDVPLETSTNYQVNEIMPRTEASKVYEQMINDLNAAVGLLSPTYPTSGPVRANKWAASSLLARVYLFKKDWVNAEKISSSVIGSGMYSLVGDLNSVFLAGSNEAILQFIPAPGGNTAEGTAFIPSSNNVIPTYAISEHLLAAFEENDSRKNNWLGTNTINGIVYYYPFKYKVGINSTITENYMVLRLAEQYLIRAEARAEQGNITGNTGAVADINLIRARAGLANTNALDQATILTAIQKERRTEFFAEWGFRWFDLKRTGSIDGVLSSEKTGWKPTSAVYPIPFSEIKSNPFLKQNAGYN